MKRLPILALAILTFASSAFSANPYEIKKIQPSAIFTPDAQASNYTKQKPRLQQWLEVEVEFQSTAEITDELTFKYYVMLAGKVLTGEVTHMNILKGRDLYSVMYVSPHTLAKLLNNKPLTGAAIENAAVQILNKGQVVAEKSFKEAGRWWEKATPLSGMMYNKNETPFSPFLWDRYEELKPPVK
ncbi:MAG: hypothetical protein QOD99_1973 [Chthoniobacter sp.]|jgi:hypothetical protein|nr:hypothetical protein [Chthoniobacter sp.]